MLKLATFIVDKRNLFFPDYDYRSDFLCIFPELGRS